MSESKHEVKGPYTLRERYTVRSPRVDRIDVVDADGDVVASVLADDTEEVENCTILEVVSKRGKANARFLRVAPQMLEALQQFEDCPPACMVHRLMAAPVRSKTGRDCDCCVCETQRVVLAAIAAATGGDSEPTTKGDPNMKPGG